MSSQTADTAPQPQAQTTFALGLGLTNECNLACDFCYRDPDRVDRLSLDEVRSVLERLPVRSVNLGTGENGMHPDFVSILRYLRTQPIKLTITSNGHSIEVLDDPDVRAFADVEFSLDYPTEVEQDRQRAPGNWRLLHDQAARCRKLGVPVTFIAVMMKSNFDRLAEVAAIAKAYLAPLRVNVYQSVRSDAFALSFEEYWTGFERLFDRTDVIAISEPLVRAMAGLPPKRGGCGVATVRVTPRARVQPCVYWPGGGAPLDLLIELGAQITATPAFTAALPLDEWRRAAPGREHRHLARAAEARERVHDCGYGALDPHFSPRSGVLVARTERSAMRERPVRAFQRPGLCFAPSGLQCCAEK
jgi:MoaA/NifB/PqqE/SkfB family radical SAM enzyme